MSSYVYTEFFFLLMSGGAKRPFPIDRQSFPIISRDLFFFHAKSGHVRILFLSGSMSSRAAARAKKATELVRRPEDTRRRVELPHRTVVEP